ncbi:hypothetical protein C5167_021109 [Papaver somniferum]|uniref:Uncharacterized protein n=1 Tax=Papaver somniferum TaxID=3469 RepID=A0A4Y7IY00_PAPSO|nr:hypothetical protein C5167_021109 [Papaver somniferum]
MILLLRQNELVATLSRSQEDQSLLLAGKLCYRDLDVLGNMTVAKFWSPKIMTADEDFGMLLEAALIHDRCVAAIMNEDERDVV